MMLSRMRLHDVCSPIPRVVHEREVACYLARAAIIQVPNSIFFFKFAKLERGRTILE